MLALVADNFFAPPYRDATLELLRQVHQLRLPIVYVTQTPGSSGTKMGADLRAGGVRRIPDDGGDSVAVYRVCEEALRRAREGTGPTLVDCHLGRTRDELEFLEKLLEHCGLWSPGWSQELLRQFSAKNRAAADKRLRNRNRRALQDR